MKIHTWAWLTWIICGLILISATRNPLYILLFDLLLLIIQIRTAERWKPGFTLRFFASMLVLSTLFNVFLSHFGETVLFTIPKQIPLINGVITAEAALYGLTNGLILIGMFTLFTILNQVLPVRALVSLIPQAFQPIAVVTTIAITFIPSTQRQFQAIKEAQAIRGQRLKGIKDWLPLFIPLLIGGLERAMQVAEAMTARGFVSQTEKPTKQKRLLLILSLSLIVIGWLVQLDQTARIAGWVLVGCGILIFLGLIFLSNEKSKRTRYTQESWSWTSTVVIISAFTTVSLFLAPFLGSNTLVYNPYPRLEVPTLGLLQLFALFLTLTPLLFHRRENHAEN